MDPELAMALRVSMEEARAAARDEPAAAAVATPGGGAAAGAAAAALDLSEEELLLQQVRQVTGADSGAGLLTPSPPAFPPMIGPRDEHCARDPRACRSCCRCTSSCDGRRCSVVSDRLDWGRRCCCS